MNSVQFDNQYSKAVWEASRVKNLFIKKCEDFLAKCTHDLSVRHIQDVYGGFTRTKHWSERACESGVLAFSVAEAYTFFLNHARCL